MWLSELVERLEILLDINGNMNVVFEQYDYNELIDVYDVVVKEVVGEDYCVITDHNYKREIQESYYEN